MRYQLANHPDRGWGIGRLQDLSRSGVGLILYGPAWPRDESELDLLLEFETDPLTSRPRLAPLRFRVRNTTAAQHGWLRIGAEGITVDAAQRETLAAWLRHLHVDL